MAAYVFVLLVGLVAGALSGVIGTGSSIMLLPILIVQFGPKQAVPIMAIAALMSNVGKVLAWRREIDWRAFLFRDRGACGRARCTNPARVAFTRY